MEVIGFWVMMSGLLLAIMGSTGSEKLLSWVEKIFFIPWYVQILAPALAVLLVLTGWHIWCLGNGGHYPAYPLNIFID